MRAARASTSSANDRATVQERARSLGEQLTIVDDSGGEVDQLTALDA
jgi:hypothetical protein